MFGTLVTTDVDRRTLEFIENPDPVAAVSRNLQDKIRFACILCRSRKVCSLLVSCPSTFAPLGRDPSVPISLLAFITR
jgi:hypothetical protein